MIRSLVGVSFPLLLSLFSSVAVAAEPPVSSPARPTSVVAEDLAPEGIVTAAIPVRYRVADPWLTRATVTVHGGASTVGAEMPLGAMAHEYTGSVDAAGLSIDLQGRRLGFALEVAGGSGERVNAPVEGIERSQLTFGEARMSLGPALNAPGLFLSVGPAIEGRMTGVGSFDPGNEALASWQTTVAGAEARSRFFLSPRVFFSGSVFAGGIPLAGNWRTVDAAGGTVEEGRLERAAVVAGTVSASLRPTESIALTGGVAARQATYGFESRLEGREGTIRPFVGLELLY